MASRDAQKSMPKSKPIMSETLRQRIAEITKRPENKSKLKHKIPDQKLPDIAEQPDQMVDRSIKVPPRNHYTSRSNANATETQSTAAVPQRPTRKTPAPSRKLDNYEKKRIDVDNYPASTIVPAILLNKDIVYQDEIQSPVRIMETRRQPRGMNQYHSKKAENQSKSDSKDRVKIIEQTRARLIGMMNTQESSSLSPDIDHSDIVKKITVHKKTTPQQSSDLGKSPMKSFFSQSSSENPTMPNGKFHTKLERIDSKGTNNIQSEYVQALKDRNQEEIKLLQSELELANLSIKNFENKLETQERVYERKLIESEQKLYDQQKLSDKEISTLNSKFQRLENEMRDRELNFNKTVELEQSREVEKLKKQLENSVPISEFVSTQKLYEEEIDALSEELKVEKQKCQSVNQLHSESQSKVKDLLEKLNKQESEYDQLQQKYSAEQDLYQKSHRALLELQSAYEAIEQECKDLKLQFEQQDIAVSEKQKLKDEIFSLEKTIYSMDQSITDKDNQLQIYEQEVNELRGKNQALQSELDQVKTAHEQQLSESRKNLGDLLAIYEELQIENHHLKSSSGALKDFDQMLLEKQDLENNVTTLERYLEDMSELYNDSVQTIERLEQQLQLKQSHGSRSNSTKTVYISNDEELLQFIETMTGKIDTYKSEVNALKEENKKLQQGTSRSMFRKFSHSDSAYQSNNASDYHSTRSRNGDFDDRLERERKLESQINDLTQEMSMLKSEKTFLESDCESHLDEIRQLNIQLNELQVKYDDIMFQTLGQEIKDGSPTVVAMRKEFRKKLEDIRSEHDQIYTAEVDKRLKVEQNLRDLKRKISKKKFQMSSEYTQT